MLESMLSEGAAKTVKKVAPDLEDDDLTLAAALVAGQAQAAIKIGRASCRERV